MKKKGNNSNKKKELNIQPRKKAKTLKELSSGFKVLPIEMPPLKVFSSINSNELKSIPITHYLFFKQHESHKQDNEIPANSAIFICNLPVDTTVAHIKHIFKHCGEIVSCQINAIKLPIFNDSVESIVFEDEEMESVFGREVYISGITAHVVFEEEKSVKKALAMKQRVRVWKVDNDSFEGEEDEEDEDEDEKLDFEKETEIMPLGYKKWTQQYKYTRPRPTALKTRVDQYMANFTRMEEIEKLELDKKLNQVDEDGFTLVTRRSRRNTNTSKDGASVTAARYEEIKDLKPKNKELQNFYRFQIKEKKRNELADLRKKFEEDKKRIEDLRSSRRFKPY